MLLVDVEGVVAIGMEGSESDSTEGLEADFRAFCLAVEPGLRRALVAAYGVELGTDAAADALAWAWGNYGRIKTMNNASGYLWRVGQSSVRREFRRRSWAAPEALMTSSSTADNFEPGLEDALASLSPRQRSAVLLVHGYGYSLTEAATQMGCRIRTLRNHLDRGLRSLRDALGVANDA